MTRERRAGRGFLNGEGVRLELGEEDRLGSAGKAWTMCEH